MARIRGERSVNGGASIGRRAPAHPERFDDGEALLEATGTLGLEGLVAKRLDEPYRPS